MSAIFSPMETTTGDSAFVAELNTANIVRICKIVEIANRLDSQARIRVGVNDTAPCVAIISNNPTIASMIEAYNK